MTVIPDDLVARLEAGHVIADPTSTLEGLATLREKTGLDDLYQLKQRPANQPVSLGVHWLERASEFVDVPSSAEALLASFPQGSLTLILDAIEPLDPRLGGSRVAVRVLAHPTARALVKRVGPVTAPSANASGVAPLASSHAAGVELGLAPASILEGDCPGGKGRTLASLTKDASHPSGYSVTIMREGVVPANEVVSWMLKRV